MFTAPYFSHNPFSFFRFQAYGSSMTHFSTSVLFIYSFYFLCFKHLMASPRKTSCSFEKKSFLLSSLPAFHVAPLLHLPIVLSRAKTVSGRLWKGIYPQKHSCRFFFFQCCIISSPRCSNSSTFRLPRPLFAPKRTSLASTSASLENAFWEPLKCVLASGCSSTRSSL